MKVIATGVTPSSCVAPIFSCVIWGPAVAIRNSIGLEGHASALAIATGAGTAAAETTAAAEIIIAIAVAEGIEESGIGAIIAAASV